MKVIYTIDIIKDDRDNVLLEVIQLTIMAK